MSKSAQLLIATVLIGSETIAQTTPSFGPRISSDVIGSPTATFLAWDVDAVDIDCDGDLDAVLFGRFLGSGDAAFHVALNDGSTPPGFSLFNSVGPSFFAAEGGAVADFDGDTIPDVVIATPTSDALVFFTNTAVTCAGGPLGFDTGVTLDTGGDFFNVRAFDADADGDLDLVAEGPGVRFYVNDGFGGFSAATMVGTGSGLSLGDLDGDGDDDIVTGHPPQWFANLGSSFGAATALPGTTSPPTNLAYSVAADFDSDGDVDVAALSGSRLVWWENDGAATFTGPTLFEDDGDPCHPPLLVNSATAGDIDSDGDIDVVGLTNDNEVFIYENTDDFTAPVTPILYSSASFLTNTLRDLDLVDMDGDLRVDLLLGDGIQAGDFSIAFNTTPIEPFFDRGGATPGPLVPTLAGRIANDAGGQPRVELFLRGAAPSVNVALLTSLHEYDPPMRSNGGLLVPDTGKLALKIDGAPPILTTDATGYVEFLSLPLPGGFTPPVPLYVQFLAQNPVIPGNVLSNAIEGDAAATP